jgi:PAS domain S-box-containing protein
MPSHSSDSNLLDSPKRHRRPLAVARRARETKLERELQAAKEFIDKILTSLNDHYVIFDKEWRYVYVNEAAARTLGLPKEQLLGKVIWELFPEAVGNQFYHELHRARDEGKDFVSEHYYAQWNMWFENRFYILPDGVAVLSIDITSRKRAEAAQRQSEQMLDFALRSANMVAWQWDIEQDVISFSHADNHIYGTVASYPSAQSFTTVYPDDLDAHRQKVWQCAHDGTPYHSTYRIIRPDTGAINWIDEWGFGLLDAEGKVSKLFGVAMESTERIEAEARLQNYADTLRELNATLEERVEQRTEELQRSNRELDQFAYVASHDLKAPLRAINHLATWIAEDAAEQLPLSSQEHLGKLQGRVRRMDTLLDDLLAYSRAGRQRHPAEMVDVGALIERVVASVAPHPDFKVKLVGEMPMLRVEQPPLETVFRNLISNAYKHHHNPGKGVVEISVDLTPPHQEGFVEFVVKDNGPGIAREFHGRIFEMFQTLKPRDQVEGSGIGLAIVKRTVDRRGGTVRVESNVGEGATFRFTWPTTVASSLSN